ncbi:hypothetical protein K435DRAFT_963697 [Dendrothele bispora CBS 962.96]|uniref:Protein kinase domain-containing protein n=1 Tax=Dendrothele bispora (strain CBS 962.96) TaxID=1314807 RepID=A0A4S8MEH9_DENBC|nr:hypothetical protein K435DRAFT_963697 [Dendrothele bispora CBS 962.96]
MRGSIAIPLPSLSLFSPFPPEMAEPTPSTYPLPHPLPNRRALTPPPRPGPPTTEQVQSTPQSAHISSQLHESYRRNNKLALQQEWLKEDLKSTILVSREVFNDLVLGANTRVGKPDIDRFRKLLDEFSRTNANYKEAMEAYLAETEKDEKRKPEKRKDKKSKERESKEGEPKAEKPRPLEKDLYNLFVTLSNVVIEELPGLQPDELCDKSQRILFYQQEPTYVRGSLSLRSVDLAVLGDGGREFQTTFDKLLPKKVSWDLIVHWDEMKRLGGASLVRTAADVKSKLVVGNVDQHKPNDVSESSDATSQTTFSLSVRATSKMIESASWSRASSTGGGSSAIPVVNSETSARRGGKRARGNDDLPSTSKKMKSSGMSNARALDSNEATRDLHDKDLETTREAKLAETAPSLLREEVQLQTAGYALEVLSSGVLRSHAIGMVVDTNEIQLGYYDHSGILLSQPFSIKPTNSTSSQLSFPFELEELPSSRLFTSDEYLHWCGYHSGFTGTYAGGYPIPCSFNYWKRYHRDRCSAKAQPQNPLYAIKLSFPSAGRASEASLLWLASKTAKQNPDWHWVERHLPGLKFWMDKELVSGQDDFPQQRIKAFLDEHCPQFGYEERVLRVLVQDKLYPLTDLRVEAQYAQVFCDVLQAHRWLYDHARILHRDISIHNIMFRKVGDEIFGVLNDLDLSSPLTNRPSATSKHRTGTRPFMAYELQDPAKKVTPLYRHDLESLFYVILCLSCRYNRQGKEDFPDRYAVWYTGSDQVVSGLKSRLTVNRENPPVSPDFSGFKQILADIKQLLYEALGAELTTKPDQFDRETANGKFTYEKFLNILKQFDGKDLTVRYSDPEPLPATPFDESTEEENRKMMKATMGQWLDDDSAQSQS